MHRGSVHGRRCNLGCFQAAGYSSHISCSGSFTYAHGRMTVCSKTHKIPLVCGNNPQSQWHTHTMLVCVSCVVCAKIACPLNVLTTQGTWWVAYFNKATTSQSHHYVTYELYVLVTKRHQCPADMLFSSLVQLAHCCRWFHCIPCSISSLQLISLSFSWIVLRPSVSTSLRYTLTFNGLLLCAEQHSCYHHSLSPS